MVALERHGVCGATGHGVFSVSLPAVVDILDNESPYAHTGIVRVSTNEYIALALTWYFELLLDSTAYNTYAFAIASATSAMAGNRL